MSTDNGHDEQRQVKDAPLRRSEEAAHRHNPDVAEGDASEESEGSFEKWQQDETR